MSTVTDSADALPLVERLGVDQAARAADFLRARGAGVMDLIAHFWDRLAQTPPLLRDDLHMLIASGRPTRESASTRPADPTAGLDIKRTLGAMLYVPKAHRADIFLLHPSAAAAFTTYLTLWAQHRARGEPQETDAASAGNPDAVESKNTTPPIDYVTGEAAGVEMILPGLLELAHRKSAAKKSVNVMMRLPAEHTAVRCEKVRAARDGDEPVLNKWRKLYRQERRILFEADVDAWIESGHVFVYERDGQIAAVAKFDLVLPSLVEIGGVFTFPEFRRRGVGGQLVCDLVCRIRETGKTPSLQVDVDNEPALALYRQAGWMEIGRLARVWLATAP